MKKLKVLLFITLALFCFSGTAYAKCQIQYDAEANRVMRLGGNTLRGNFATPEQCQDYWRSRPAFERNHSKCVGCDEDSASRPQQNIRRRQRGNTSVVLSGPTNRTPEEDWMLRQARGRPVNRQLIRAYSKYTQLKDEYQKEQARIEFKRLVAQIRGEDSLDTMSSEETRVEFEQGKKEMITQLKGGSGGGDLHLKGGGKTLSLKPGNIPIANQQGKAIKDLRKSVYWSLEAANAVSIDNYESARTFADFPNQKGGDTQLPSVPDVPAPVRADPQVRLYQFLIKEVNQTTSELKLIDTNLEQAKEEKRKSERKIDLQKTKIEELKQKKSECEKKAHREGVSRFSAEAQALQKEQEEMDKLIAEARAAEAEAEKQDKEAEKNLASLNKQKKEQEENLSNLQQVFDTAEKHPEQAGKILKKLEGGK